MAVMHGGEDSGGEEGGSGLDVFLVAGLAEPVALAGEGEQAFVAAVVAADTGKATVKFAAVEEFVDDLLDDGAQGAEVDGELHQQHSDHHDAGRTCRKILVEAPQETY